MFHPALKLSDLNDDDVVPVTVEGTEMVVYRNGDSIRACQRYCPHQQSDLSEGLLSRGLLICSAHGWQFDANTGQHDSSSDVCLATYAVEVRGDMIHINPTPAKDS
jgi:nitrite reductase/ring-hydroxylating ferredoxin subunit